jgi:RNA polymerase sigma-70 factor, ECF subfamily
VAREHGDAVSRLEPFRTELTGYCYRMLGSGFDAEDAVQETLVRAWRSFDRYEERRGSLQAWLYRIATNICLDMLRATRRRRSLAMDLTQASATAADFREPAPEHVWVQPIPDAAAVVMTGTPEEVAVRRETIRLAFVAALQHLPPRQRAVLILRDVLCWKADEVADLLETTVASVNSALQRARSTLRAVDIVPGDALRPADPAQRELLSRYCQAFERHDVASLVALLHEDATMSMPPVVWWLRGREQIRRAMLDPSASCEGARLVPTAANGSPAFWQTRPSAAGVHLPFGLVVLDVRNGLVAGLTTYLDVERLIPLFGDAARGTRPGPVAG